FAATILGIILQPLPSGAIMILGVTLPIFTGVLNEAKALSGFANGTVWLIFCAYILSIGFVKTGLGRRIAYRLISWMGGSSLGIAYALGVSDLIMAPAMPSVTARAGGVIFPIVRSINTAMGSEPGPTGRKIGNFLIMTCFLYATVTGAMFLTGMAANPLCAELARKTLKLDITWSGWAWAALAPGLICFVLTPLLLYVMIRPEMRRTTEAREMGDKALREMGPMTGKEWALTLVFILALAGWATSFYTKLSATTVALGGVSLLFLFGVVGWKDVLKEHAAWDTLIWFGAIISLANGLSDLGFIKWLTAQLSIAFHGWSWLLTFVGLGLVYIYIHYAFATASGHAAAVYAPFVAAAVAAGAPPMMVAICFGIFTNIMWGLTEYGGGPGPIYFSQGYYERPAFYRLNLAVTTMNVAVFFVVGLVWWKFIGLY
ncbi:MAG TPA: DASS family sodium-coupled anion symporter, partial [Thermodesulfobacteriota bacterium]|nr:DASS family sodium-coupled anion symporter [Thermodesulfobacteriota bacterium]